MLWRSRSLGKVRRTCCGCREALDNSGELVVDVEKPWKIQANLLWMSRSLVQFSAIGWRTHTTFSLPHWRTAGGAVRWFRRCLTGIHVVPHRGRPLCDAYVGHKIDSPKWCGTLQIESRRWMGGGTPGVRKGTLMGRHPWPWTGGAPLVGHPMGRGRQAPWR